MDQAAVIARLTAERARFEALGVTHVYLFGSVARGEARPDSDVDVMVDLDEGPGGRKPLFSAFELAGYTVQLATSWDAASTLQSAAMLCSPAASWERLPGRSSPMFSKSDKVHRAIRWARDDIARPEEWAHGLTISDLRADVKLRYAVERAFMTLAVAICDIPASTVAKHGGPAHMIAGLRNILAHTYDDILDDRVISTIGVDLPARDAQLPAILADFDAA